MSHIVIDGYNLIRRSPTLSQIDAKNLEKGRTALLHLLKNYRERQGHSITVVFDASHSPNMQIEKDFVGGIEVIYSEQGKTADEILIRIARHFGSRVILVSSDKEILRAAKSSGSGYITADEFLDRVGAYRDTPLHESSRDTDNRLIHKRWLTKKKGPAKRLPKEKRRALKGL